MPKQPEQVPQELLYAIPQKLVCNSNTLKEKSQMKEISNYLTFKK
jgi:hypothetical protein